MEQKKSKKNMLTAIGTVAVVLICCLGNAGIVNAVSQPTVSTNIHRQSYVLNGAVNGDWANIVKSHLIENENGTISRIEAVNDGVLIETYQKKDLQLEESKVLSMELPLFGGFYAGESYHYLFFGQSNQSEEDSCEVVRIVQYTKDWERIGAAGLYGANTTYPFDAGSLRVCELGNMLYIRTSHEMYQTADGLNHQSNMTICYQQDTGTITNQSSAGLLSGAPGYVSHSFNQFVQSNGSKIYTVDHGDGYPRAIVLQGYTGSTDGGLNEDVNGPIHLVSFPGETGLNYTGVSVGGLEVNDETCLTAYNSVDPEYFYGDVRNVFVSVVPKNNFTEAAVETKQFTTFTPTGNQSASNPVLVSLPDGNYMLLWEIYDADEVRNISGKPGTQTIQYIRIDKNGNEIGSIHTEAGDLSDCTPIVVDNQLVWYVTDSSAPVFYHLDLGTETLNATSVGGDKNVSSAPSTSEKTQPPASSSSSVTGNTGTTSNTGNTSKKTSAAKVTKPKKVTGVKVWNYKKRKIAVMWNRRSGVSGYQVQCARNRKFTKGKKTAKVSKYDSDTLFKKLKKKKTYYVRVRAYKKSGGVKKYGTWSKVKKIKTK